MPGKRAIRLVESARGTIEAEARARYPEECCGGLLGRERDDGGRIVLRAVPTRNQRAEERERRYLLGPAEVLGLEDAAEDEDLTLLGFFHSHPDHPPVPSAYDREHAWPWYSYLIVSVEGGDPGRIRSWRLDDERERFSEEALSFDGPDSEDG